MEDLDKVKISFLLMAQEMTYLIGRFSAAFNIKYNEHISQRILYFNSKYSQIRNKWRECSDNIELAETGYKLLEEAQQLFEEFIAFIEELEEAVPKVNIVVANAVNADTSIGKGYGEHYGAVLSSNNFENVFRSTPSTSSFGTENIPESLRKPSKWIVKNVAQYRCTKCLTNDHAGIRCRMSPKCFLCNNRGHTSEACALNECSLCGSRGHGRVACTSEYVKCRKCDGYGHVWRECTNQIKCHNCNEFGHLSKNCDMCYKCKIRGHLPERCNAVCYNCRQKFHIYIECKQPPCALCKSVSHGSADCPK